MPRQATQLTHNPLPAYATACSPNISMNEVFVFDRMQLLTMQWGCGLVALLNSPAGCFRRLLEPKLHPTAVQLLLLPDT